MPSERLPDQAVSELQPGEIQQYGVVRVAEEILVDLMRSAGGFDYEQASQGVSALLVLRAGQAPPD
jgi:hypothetical protein